jgi:hypothetical protein
LFVPCTNLASTNHGQELNPAQCQPIASHCHLTRGHRNGHKARLWGDQSQPVRLTFAGNLNRQALFWQIDFDIGRSSGRFVRWFRKPEQGINGLTKSGHHARVLVFLYLTHNDTNQKLALIWSEFSFKHVLTFLAN